MEFRKPISFIKRRIDTDLYFCMGMSDSMTWGARPQQTEFFGYPMESFTGKPQIAGTIQGFAYWGKEYKGILEPACNVNTRTSTSLATLIRN